MSHASQASLIISDVHSSSKRDEFRSTGLSADNVFWGSGSLAVWLLVGLSKPRSKLGASQYPSREHLSFGMGGGQLARVAACTPPSA